MPIPAPTGNELFDAAELSGWLGRPVSDDKAAMVEAVVWGWLKPVLGLSERPAPVPAEVFSWAIELGANAHENPAGFSSKQLGSSQQAFSLERRNEILDRAATGSATSALRPRGCFPAAQRYPDPACP